MCSCRERPSSNIRALVTGSLPRSWSVCSWHPCRRRPRRIRSRRRRTRSSAPRSAPIGRRWNGPTPSRSSTCWRSTRSDWRQRRPSSKTRARRSSLGGREPRAAAVHQRRRRCGLDLFRGSRGRPARSRPTSSSRVAANSDHVVDRRVRGGAGRPREEAGRAGQQAGADRAGRRDARGHAGQGARGRRGVHPAEAGADQGRPDQGGARGAGSRARRQRGRRTARGRRGCRRELRPRNSRRPTLPCKRLRMPWPATGGGYVGRQLGWVERWRSGGPPVVGRSGGDSAGDSGGGDEAPAPHRRRPPPAPAFVDGIICPVAGPTAFGDSWGAGRSGGRSHQGVDMMASRGTPIVAVVSGSVQFRQNSLGGNAVWLSGSNGHKYFYAHLDAFEGDEPGRVAGRGDRLRRRHRQCPRHAAPPLRGAPGRWRGGQPVRRRFAPPADAAPPAADLRTATERHRLTGGELTAGGVDVGAAVLAHRRVRRRARRAGRGTPARPSGAVPVVGQPGVGFSGMRLTWAARGSDAAQLGELAGVGAPVVDAVDQRPLERQPAPLRRAGSRRHASMSMLERVAAVDRHELVAQLVVGGVQGHGEVHRAAAGGRGCGCPARCPPSRR